MPSKPLRESQPTFIGSGLNAKPLIRFDGSDDYLQFNEINNLATVFMVVEQQTGNNGFLLGHEDSFAFHSGAGTAWSDTWTDAYVLNGILQVNGNLLDGLQQNLGYDQPQIVAIQTTGMLRASNFSKDRNNAIHWKGDLAELIIYNEALPVSTMRQVEGYRP